MTEYLVITCLVAVGSVVVFTAFGDVVRKQVAAAAYELAGQSDKADAEDPTASTSRITNNKDRDLSDFVGTNQR